MATTKDTFEALGKKFDIDEKAIKALIGTGVQNLEEFRFYFTSEDEVKSLWIDAVSDLGNARLQVARARRAWVAVTEALKTATGLKRKVGEQDDDELLPSLELSTMAERFWSRHKLRLPAELLPADALTTRLSREVDRRLLTVMNIWSVKSMAHQRVTEPKKKEGGW